MKRLFICLTCAATLAACDKGTKPGLLVQITLASALKTNCVALEVQNPSDGKVLLSAVTPRPSGDAPVTVAVGQGSLPSAVSLQAIGYSGADCEAVATRKLTSRSVVKPVDFPARNITTVDLALGLPDETIDADRDGVVAVAQGGVDCDDTNAEAFPGATQRCESPVDLNCDGAIFCADAACSTNAICMRPPDRLLFKNSPPVGVRTFECSPPLTIESRDALGAAAATKNLAVTLTGSLVGTTFYSDPACSVAITSATILYGQTQTTAYSKTTSTGAQTVTAASSGLTSVSQTFNVAPQPVVNFIFSPPTISATAGDCVEVTLQTTDSEMRPTTSVTSLTGFLNALPQAGTQLYPATDTGCTGPAMGGSVTFDQVDRVSFRVRSVRATLVNSPLQIVATSATVATPGNLKVTVKPAAPKKLAFITQAPGLLVNTCSGPIVGVGLQDEFNNLTTSPTETPVRLSATRTSASSATLSFSSDPAGLCGSGAATLDTAIAANQSSTPLIQLKGTGRSEWAMTATAPTTTLVDGTQTATVANDKPSRIAFISNPVTAVAGRCSPSSVQIETRDSSNDRSAVPTGPTGAPLVVDVEAMGLQFFSDNTCSTPLEGTTVKHITIAQGQAEGGFYFRGSTPGSVEIKATAALYQPPNNVARQNQVVKAGPPFALTWSGTTSQTITAGGCTAAPFTLTLTDDQGNQTAFSPTQAQTIDVATLPLNAVTAFANASCMGAAPAFAAGASQAQAFATSTQRGIFDLSASVPGIPSSNQARLTVNPGAYSALVFFMTPTTGTLRAGQCQEITVERRDGFGNPVDVTGNTDFQLSSSGAGVKTYPTQTDCENETNVLTGNVRTINSGARATLYLRVRNAPQMVPFSVASGGVSTPAGSSFSLIPAAASILVFTTPAASTAMMSAGGCLPIVVERRDRFQNVSTENVLAVPIMLTGAASLNARLSADNMCAGTLANPSIAAGSGSAAFYLRAVTAGPVSVSSNVAGFTNAGPLDVTVGPGAPTVLALITNPAPPPSTVTAGSCNEVKAERRDAQGNVVSTMGTYNINSNPTSGFSAYASLNDCNTASMPIGSVNSNGQGSFWVRSTLAGDSTVTVQAEGMASFSLRVVAAAASKINVEGPATVTATACSAFTLNRFDAYNNPAIAGLAQSYTLSSTLSGATFSQSNTCAPAGATVTLNPTDTTKTFYFSRATVGSGTITAMGTFTSTPRMVDVTAGSPTTLAFTSAPTGVTAGECKQMTVEARDSGGNAANVTAATTVTLGASTGVASFHTSNADCTTGAGINPIASTSIAMGTSTSPTLYVKFKAAPTTTLTATATGLTAASQPWSVIAGAATKLTFKAPPAMLNRFTCTAVTIATQDDYQNEVNPTVAQTITLSATPAAHVLFFTGSDCSGASTTTASLPTSASTVTIRLLASGSGTATLDATSALAPASTMLTLAGSLGALVGATISTANIEYNDCEEITVTRKDPSNVDFTSGSTTFSVTPASSSITVHSDIDCTSAPVAAGAIAPGDFKTSFYVKGHSGTGVVNVVFNDDDDGFSNGTLPLTALPLVRRGTCTIPSLSDAGVCTIAPAIPGSDLSRTFMVVQAAGGNAGAASATVQCSLTSTSRIDCGRVANAAELINISWQTVSAGRGISPSYSGGFRVQHLTGSLDAGTPTDSVTLPMSVDAGRAFVLFSTSSGAANTMSPGDTISAQLPNATSVAFGTGAASFQARPLTYALQVVEIDGLTVDRGTTSASTTALATTITGLPSRLTAQTFPLMSGYSTAPEMCFRRWTTTQPDATSLTFTRGTAAAVNACADVASTIDWQRIYVPGAAVQACSINFSGTSTGTCTLGAAPGALDRTLFLLPGQGPGGQNMGSTSSTSTTAGLGNSSGIITLVGTTVTVTRPSSSNSRSDFTPYVIEFPQ